MTNSVLSLTDLGGGKMEQMVIWMDDRQRPSEHSVHTQAGSRGRW